MENNLTKKEIKEKVVPAKVMSSRLWRLTIRYCRILERAEKMEAKDIPVADAKEILRIEDELRGRLTKAIGHDFYPPDRVEKEAPSNYMISLLKSRNKSLPRATEIIHPCSAVVTKKAEAEMKKEGLLRFKITITSSIGSVVKAENVKVDIRSDADLIAHTMIEQLGLKKAKYKIT